MKKKYISNLNTVSALFDRLITEKIKQYFFYLSKEKKKFKIQTQLINSLHNELQHTFKQIIKSRQYKFIKEKRTFDKDMKNFIYSVENLIVMNLNVGKSDNNLSKILKNLKLSRASLERRAKIKNDIDDLVKKIIS